MRSQHSLDHLEMVRLELVTRGFSACAWKLVACLFFPPNWLRLGIWGCSNTWNYFNTVSDKRGWVFSWIGNYCLFYSPGIVKITFLFLVKRDFGKQGEPRFFTIILSVTIGFLIHCELWFSFMLFERNYYFYCPIEAGQLSKCDDVSFDDNDSVLDDHRAEPQLLNKELGFLFTAPRTRSGRTVRTSNKAVLWL